MIIKKNIIIIISFFVILFHLNLFQNFYDIFSKNYDQRMIKSYGDHDKQGYGFIKKINSKYKLNQNFIYYNYDMAEPHWLIDLKPTYLYNLKEFKNIDYDQTEKNKYIIIIDEPFNEIDFFIKKNNYKIILRETNSYFLSIL
jgi:hypothetical protein